MHTPLWALAHSRQAIIIGPWTSEMGFEVLYWLPYLDYLRQTYRLDRDRLYVLTRGGAGEWYNVGHSVELYDYVPPGDVRLLAHRAQREAASIKQLRITPWERRLVDLVAERHGLRRYHILHPSRLYQALDGWWSTLTVGMAQAMKILRWSDIPVPPPPVGLALPERFMAVRFYARATWPLTDELLDWTRTLILNLAQTIPVVVLRSSAYLDDHADFPAPTGPNITVVEAGPYRENLAIQSAILKRAAGFVGTWGGMAQLAVRLKVPTVALYERWHGVSYAHRSLTEWLAMQTGVPLYVGTPWTLEAVRSVIPQAIDLPDPPKGSSS